MGEWHRDNPELAEQGYEPPDPSVRADMILQELKDGERCRDCMEIRDGFGGCGCTEDRP